MLVSDVSGEPWRLPWWRSPFIGVAGLEFRANQLCDARLHGNRGAQAVFCEVRLPVDGCKTAADILTSHLQAYPVAQLGTWTWVIVPADHWNDLGRDLGLDLDSPAYTCLEDRMTLIDESMLAQKDPRRNADLLRKFEMPLAKLIDFAVTHEIGHALCGFKDEYKAEAVGKRLREGQLPYCSLPEKVREKLPLTLQADVWAQIMHRWEPVPSDCSLKVQQFGFSATHVCGNAASRDFPDLPARELPQSRHN